MKMNFPELDAAKERLLAFFKENWNVECVCDVLSVLNGGSADDRDFDSFRNRVVFLNLNPRLGKGLENPINAGTYSKIVKASEEIDQMIPAIERLKKLNHDMMDSDTAIPEDYVDCSAVRYMYGRYADLWKRKYQSDGQAFGKFLKEWACRSKSRFGDFLSGARTLMFYEMNGMVNLGRVKSSDYWKERSAGHITPTNTLSLDGLGDWRCRMLLDAMLNSNLPKKSFPRYYALLCGESFRHSVRVRLKFVAKYMDCSREGLYKVAEDFVGNVLEFDKCGLDVSIDNESIKVGNIQFYSKPYAEVSKVRSPFNLLGSDFFDEDIDYVENALGEETPMITFVEFDSFFDLNIRLETVPEPCPDYTCYRRGVKLEDNPESLIPVLRHVFENPSGFYVDEDWIVCDLTLESFREFQQKKHFGSLWRVPEVLRDICEFDHAEPWKAFEQMWKDLGDNACHSNVDVCFQDGYMGTNAFDANLEKILEELRSLGTVLHMVLENWEKVNTPRRLTKRVAQVVVQDPLLFTETNMEPISNFARGIVV